MNDRTRQWIRARAMLDKYEPEIVASVKDVVLHDGIPMCEIVTFRQSKLQYMRDKYGNRLEIIAGIGMK